MPKERAVRGPSVIARPRTTVSGFMPGAVELLMLVSSRQEFGMALSKGDGSNARMSPLLPTSAVNSSGAYTGYK